MKRNKPNILLILTDQQSASAMSIAGNKYLNTPNMDKLATEGSMFTRAYCTQPLCTPCRGSIFTGLMPHQCGTTMNNCSINENLRQKEIGNLLANAGYECVYAGKWHVPEIAMPQNNSHGFITISGFNDKLMASACEKYFREYVRRGTSEKKPFFMVASFDNPHNICEFARRMPLPWASIGEVPPIEKLPPLPQNFEPPDIEPEIVRIEQKANFMIYPTVNYTEEDWRRLRWGYFRLVEWVDHEIGKVLHALHSYKLEQETVVIFMSDHGDAHATHRWNQKSILYEEVVRIPLIIKIPCQTKGSVNSSLVSAPLDVFTTICNLAQISPPENASGINLCEIAENKITRDYVVIETIFDGNKGYNSTGRAIVTNQFKYIVYDKGKNPEQLFDLQNDPGEMKNLVFQKPSEVSSFRKLLLEWQKKTNDFFMHPLISDGKK